VWKDAMILPVNEGKTNPEITEILPTCECVCVFGDYFSEFFSIFNLRDFPAICIYTQICKIIQ
jgi:hypothetical protein